MRTKYEHVMFSMAGVAASMQIGWIYGRSEMGVFVGGIIGAVLVAYAFYPEQESKTGGDTK